MKSRQQKTTMEAIKIKLYAGGRSSKAEAMTLTEVPPKNCVKPQRRALNFCEMCSTSTIINGKAENARKTASSAPNPYYRTRGGCLLAHRIETIVEQANTTKERGVCVIPSLPGRALSGKKWTGAPEAVKRNRISRSAARSGFWRKRIRQTEAGRIDACPIIWKLERRRMSARPILTTTKSSPFAPRNRPV